MMNTVVGSAIGGLVAGAVALGAAAVMKPSPAPAYAPDPNGVYAMPVANTSGLGSGALNPASMQCQPYEEAVLRRAFVGGREVTDVTCITRSSAYAPQGAYLQQPLAQPVVYRDSVVTRPAARTVAARSNVSAAQRAARESDHADRSWAKTAMVIGGSAGGGAGIGGLIGGKKGALIGAALGGGAATIYEARKR
jgi:hypothetical protein